VAELLTVWREVADGFTERLELVRAEDWVLPTVCERWNVTKLVDHAVGAQRMVPKALGAIGDIDRVGDDPIAVWGTVREAANEAFSADGALEKTVKLPFGEMAAKDGLGFPMNDLLVHTWDLARAIGVNDRLAPEACSLALHNMEPIDALLRAPGFFGPKLEPTADADVQDRLLAFLGRDVRRSKD